MRFRRGDIVWARVLFPKKWWPGLVRSIDGHRIAVSFFNDGEDPHVFLETEVISFEENFESLSKTLKNCSRGEKLLDRALKLLARRAVYGLRCACHFRPPEKGDKFCKRRGDAFRPEKLLSLVRGLAVLAFVGDSDFVCTVTMASQIHVFRRYLVADRKVFVDSKATKERLQNFDLPVTGACSMAQSSEVSKLGFESLNVDIPAPPESYPSSPIESLGLKRHYDHSVESDIRFKLRKTMPLPSINGIHADTERSEIGRTACGLESLISMPSSSDLSLKFCNRMPLSFYNCTDSVVQNSSRCEENTASFDKVSVETRCCLPTAARSDYYHVPVETNRLKSSDALGFRECSTEKKVHLPMVASDALSSMHQIARQSPHAIKMEQCTSIGSHKISVENGTQDGINAACSSRENSMVKLLLPLVNSDASSSMPQEAQQSETAIQMDHSTDNHNIPVENDKQDDFNEAFSSMKKLLLPLVNSDASSSIPQEAQQSETAIQMDHSTDNHNIPVENDKQDDFNEAFSSMKKLLLPLVNSDASSSIPQEAQQSETAIQMDHSTDNHNIPVENDKQDDFNEAFSSMKKLLLPLLISDTSSSIPLEAQQSENSIQMDRSRRNHSISIEAGRQDGINEAFSLRESSVKTLLLPLLTTDAPSSVPQEAPQLENAFQMDHSRDNHNISFENSRQEGINADASSSMPQEAPQSENAILMHHSRGNHNILSKTVDKMASMRLLFLERAL